MFLRLFFVKGRKYLSVPHLADEGAQWLQQCGQVEDVHLVQGIVDRADHAEHRVQALLHIAGVNKRTKAPVGTFREEKDLLCDLCSATFLPVAPPCRCAAGRRWPPGPSASAGTWSACTSQA